MNRYHEFVDRFAFLTGTRRLGIITGVNEKTGEVSLVTISRKSTPEQQFEEKIYPLDQLMKPDFLENECVAKIKSALNTELQTPKGNRKFFITACSGNKDKIELYSKLKAMKNDTLPIVLFEPGTERASSVNTVKKEPAPKKKVLRKQVAVH